MTEKEYSRDGGEAITIAQYDDYSLTETTLGDGMSHYEVVDGTGDVRGDFHDVTLTDSERVNVEGTGVYETFLDIIDEVHIESGDYDYDGDDGDAFSPTSIASSYIGYDADYGSERDEATVESLCKSDTIVFHLDDPSTVMLRPIYEGKGWDVYTGSPWGGLCMEDVHELIRRHDKIICLGHGTPRGLIGGNIGPDEVPLLKGKRVFALWCYAATFFRNSGMSGQGILCSDNAPSEVWECEAACGAEVSARWIYDNITYWGECLADVLEMSWTDPQRACELARKNYHKSYAYCRTDDERKVVEFNTNTIQVV